MDSFSDWWSGLTVVLKIFWSLALPFTAIFVLQLILSFMGHDSPDDIGEADVDSDHGAGFQFFTLKNFIGFFTIFGWAGIAMIESGASTGAAITVATVSGTLMMFVMAGMFYLLMKAQHDGTMKIEKAVGHTGEVYLTIPSKRASVGKVQIVVQGALRTLDALTDDEADIQTGKIVKVSKIVNDSTLLVTLN